MYAYIYDEFTNQGKYNKILYKIEKRLTDLSINGKIARLGISKKIETAVKDQIRQGAKTIVAIGNNETALKTINAIISNENSNSLTLGIIPLDEKDNYLAEIMGINNIEDACDILLGRRLETFRPVQINKNYFLFNIKIENPNVILEIDKDYAIKNIEPAEIEITNNPLKQEFEKLKLTIQTKENKSCFCFNEILIVNKDAGIVADNSLRIESPARIIKCDKKIKIIVGRNRNF